MYWLPKLHKRPYKARLSSFTCVTKWLITKSTGLVEKHLDMQMSTEVIRGSNLLFFFFLVEDIDYFLFYVNLFLSDQC